MYKIGIIGDEQSVLGFAALGLDIYPVNTAEEAAKILHRLAFSYGILYITEDMAECIAEDIRQYASKMVPSIIPIPSVKGSTGYGARRVQEATIKAIGSDILMNTEY